MVHENSKVIGDVDVHSDDDSTHAPSCVLSRVWTLDISVYIYIHIYMYYIGYILVIVVSFSDRSAQSCLYINPKS